MVISERSRMIQKEKQGQREKLVPVDRAEEGCALMLVRSRRSGAM